MIRLCPNVSSAFAEALDKASLFSAKKDMERLRDTLEPREQPQYGKPGESCKYNLFFGFFFDGTRNNYMACEPSDPQAAATKRKEKEARKSPNCHSNVARLYDIYPGQSVPGVLAPDTDWAYKPELYKHFFKVYVPGVGTEFKQIGDTGKGLLDGTLGAAAANNGSARLVWALVQAINNVHRFFKQGAMLITADEAHRLANRTYLSASTLKRLSERGWFADPSDDGATDPSRATREAFTGLLTRLHDAIRPHWPTGPDLKPARLDPGMVQKINVSVFGFSRGATKARVFVNWLQALGKLDAQLSGMSTKHAMTLGGFPFEIEFLGIFDTVASVGLANTLGNSLFGRWLDGHSAWSDAEVSLRVPSDVRCLHLVAAHEVRRSFPLDSISVNGQYDGKMQEIVLPGVHSDIGGGYAPQEQGKGLSTDGEDMLSRIPLIMMYREARLSGVPLKLELASDKAKKRFALSRRTIDDFNRYLEVCQAGKPVVTQAGQTVWPSSLTDIFREQRQLYIQWRLLRRVVSRCRCTKRTASSVPPPSTRTICTRPTGNWKTSWTPSSSGSGARGRTSCRNGSLRVSRTTTRANGKNWPHGGMRPHRSRMPQPPSSTSTCMTRVPGSSWCPVTRTARTTWRPCWKIGTSGSSGQNARARCTTPAGRCQMATG